MLDLSSGTSMALMPMVIVGLGVGLGLFFIVAMSKREPYPGFRKPVLWFTGIMLAAIGTMIFMTQVGPRQWLKPLGQPTTWAVLLFLAFGAVAVGAVVKLMTNPKTRPWTVALLVAGGMVFLPVLLLVAWLKPMSVSWQDTSKDYRSRSRVVAKVERPQQIPRNVAKIDPRRVDRKPTNESLPSESTDQTEPRPSGSGIRTEPRPSGSEPSKNTSGKETTKPLSSWRGSDERGSNQPSRPGRDPAESSNTSPDEKRPDWVDQQPRKIGNVYHRVLVVGPYTTRLECDNKMSYALNHAVKEYIGLFLEDNHKYHWPITLPEDYIRNHIVKKTWEENKDTSVGPMTQVHVLLAFDQTTNDRITKELNDLWYHQRGQQRVAVTVVALGSVLAVLLIAYLMLKFNVAPKLIPYRWHALQALIVGALILMAIITLFLCLYVDDNLHKYTDITGPNRILHLQAQRAYVQLAWGLCLVLPFMGATMIFLSIKKKTRILGITGGVVVLIVTLGAFLILGL